MFRCLYEIKIRGSVAMEPMLTQLDKNRIFLRLCKGKSDCIRTLENGCIVLYCIVLKGWSLLSDALRPIQDLLCSSEFRYY